VTGEVLTLVTTWTYDSENNITSMLDAEGNLTKYEYDANGNQVAVIDALGRRTESRYDKQNQLIDTFYADDTPNNPNDNPRISYQYDAKGGRTAIIDQEGNTGLYTYDPLARPTGLILPDETPDDLEDNPRVMVQYDQAGQTKAIIDESGYITEYEYENGSRMTLARNAEGEETTFTHDAARREIARTDALGRTTEFVYDELDRLVKTIFPDGTTTKTEYDVFGNVIAETDQLGRVTKYEYDALDRLTAVVDALENRTEYRYDEAGNLVYQEDANGHITRFEYDGLGRPIAVVRPMGQRMESVYNAVGLLERSIDFNGEVIEYFYDDLNNLRTKSFVDEERTVEFTYTTTGRIETVTDNRGLTQFNYDERGRLQSRTEPDGTTISYTYYAFDLVETVTTPSGTTTYAYDELYRIDAVTASGKVTNYNYDSVGNLTKIIYNNGIVEVRSYDELNRLTSVVQKDADENVIASYNYTLDALGNLLLVEELGGRQVEYSYDELYRLTSEQIADLINGDRAIDYFYDAVGNRLSKEDSVEGITEYFYNENDHLLWETTAQVTTHYTYDDNGNVTSINSPEQQIFYNWDGENRLINAVITDNEETTNLEYKYDANGIRVASIVDGLETRYLVDANRSYSQVLEEYTPDGTVEVSYVYGNNLISQTREGEELLYFFDGHSGVRLLTNELGQVTDSYSYDGYGNVLSETGESENNYLYRGEQFDPNLQMQYLRARYYQLSLGRFASVDPFAGVIEKPITSHRYLYAYNNPISYQDPSGATPSLGDILEASVLLGILTSLTTTGVVIGQLFYSALSVSSDPDQLVIEWNGGINALDVTGWTGFGFHLASVDADGGPIERDGRLFKYNDARYILYGGSFSPSLDATSDDGVGGAVSFGTFTTYSPLEFGISPWALTGSYSFFEVSGTLTLPIWFPVSISYGESLLSLGYSAGTASGWGPGLASSFPSFTLSVGLTGSWGLSIPNLLAFGAEEELANNP